MRLLLTILLLCGFSVSLSAQTQTDIRLADQYFRSGDFDKAAIYYESFLKKHRNHPLYFERLYKSFIQLGEVEKAEKMLRKEIKRNPNNLMNKIHLGQLLSNNDRKDEASKIWDKVIKDLNGNQGEIIKVAREFSSIGEHEYALKTYEKGKKLIKSFYTFNYEIAEVYGLLGRHEEMVNMYLELINVNPAYIQSVQNTLARNFDFEERNQQTEILRTQLLKKIQKHPDNSLYAEMLIWMQVQQKDFFGALIQTQALDRRQKEDGNRVMNLARLAGLNYEWDVALKGFDYVIGKGKYNYYYIDALYEKTAAWKSKLDENPNAKKEEYKDLATEAYQAIEQLGVNENSVRIIQLLAAVEAQKLNNQDTAIALLENVIGYPRLNAKSLALSKIDLGDYLVLRGEIWDAALYYMQAEKAFKYDEIGDLAKFKAAKISYFTGDFEWARAQLDVLKGSTSKLIANDAMYLSHLITDNTGLDTIFHPMEIFARADLLKEQLQYEKAITTLDSINTLYPGHMLEDDIHMLTYKIRIEQKEYNKAATSLQKIIDEFSWDILGDDAVFRLAELYDYKLNDKEKAMELYEKILVDYESSLFSTEARKRFRSLRGDLID